MKQAPLTNPTPNQPPPQQCPNWIRPSRTDAEIVEQTNDLARAICEAGGLLLPPDHKFHSSINPLAQHAWKLACIAQEMLTDTDPDDALHDEAANCNQ